MRLLFISKRRPQGRDLVTRPYGRFVHLPLELLRLGHEVRVTCIGLRAGPESETTYLGLPIQAINLLPSPWHGLRKLQRECREWQPDWIIGGSDIYPGLLASHLASFSGAKVALDAYDDFESYAPWAVPAHWLWRRALARCDLASAAGPQLLQKMTIHAQRAVAAVVPMAADPEFSPSSKRLARQVLNLPKNALLFGYTGSLDTKRGGQLLLDAWRQVAKRDPAARLVLCGRNRISDPNLPGVIHLGYVDDEHMPAVQRSLDAAIVLGSNSAFSQFSYPSKLCEAIACGPPVVATATGPIQWMTSASSVQLVPIGDEGGLAEALTRITSAPDQREAGQQPCWAESARALAQAMDSIFT